MLISTRIIQLHIGYSSQINQLYPGANVKQAIFLLHIFTQFAKLKVFCMVDLANYDLATS